MTGCRFGWLPLVLLPALLPAQGYAYEETFERTVPAEGITALTVRNHNGEVDVKADDRPEIRIRATKRVKRGDPADAAGLARRIEIAVETNGSELSVSTRVDGSSTDRQDWVDALFSLDWLFNPGKGGASVDYDITVPARLAVAVSNTNGNAEIAGVEGKIKATTVNGNVVCARARGGIEARTVNGNVSAEAVEGGVDAGTVNGSIEVRLVGPQVGACELGTVNGSIELDVPGSAAVDIDARTVNGKIVSELPLAVQGEVSKRRIKGQLNGGGPQVKLETTNGSIQIGDAGR
jgi:hypothetical protein